MSLQVRSNSYQPVLDNYVLDQYENINVNSGYSYPSSYCSSKEWSRNNTLGGVVLLRCFSEYHSNSSYPGSVYFNVLLDGVNYSNMQFGYGRGPENSRDVNDFIIYFLNNSHYSQFLDKNWIDTIFKEYEIRHLMSGHSTSVPKALETQGGTCTQAAVNISMVTPNPLWVFPFNSSFKVTVYAQGGLQNQSVYNTQWTGDIKIYLKDM